MRRFFVSLGLVSACGLAACGDDPGPQGAAAVRIVHYDYRFDVESRAAHAKVTAVFLTPGNCFSLPLRAESFDPTTALVDGAPAAAGSSLVDEKLTLCGERGHEDRDEIVFEVDLVVGLRTLRTTQVGYSVTMDAQQNPFYYLVSWISGCARFTPCDPDVDTFATYTFHVTHPASHLARCPGAITEVSPTETRCDFTFDGGPTYSTFGVAAYPAAAWTRTDKGTWGSAKVTLYDRAQTQIGAAIDPAYHAGFMSFMESTFGRYPYGDELRILTAPTYWSGFEHPGNIVLDDLLANGMSSYLHPVAHVLDHEIVHMWAGNQTTLENAYDFTWKEAMAEYLTYVYETMADPVAAAVTAGAWKSFSLGAAYFPMPLESAQLLDYYGDVYGAGPMVLFRQAEALTSRAQVIAALQSVLGRARTLSVEELLDALVMHTGIDRNTYNAWIYGTGAPEWPRVALTYNIGGATDMLRVQQTAAPSRRCKFHVGLRGAGPGELMLVPVDTLRDGIDQVIPIMPQPVFTVTSVELDPLRECLVFPELLAPAPRVNPWLSPRVVD